MNRRLVGFASIIALGFAALSLSGQKAQLAQATVGDDLSSLLTSYIDSNTYTKKTAIYLNETALATYGAHFHAGAVNRTRMTTYYDETSGGALLMGDYDGTFSHINSGYYSGTTYANDGYHYVYNGDGSSTADLFSNRRNEQNWHPGTTIKAQYENLSSLATYVAAHSGDWSEADGVYTHQIVNLSEEDYDQTLHHFQYFAAPMLLDQTLESHFLSPTRIVVQAAPEYLSIRLYTASTDSGKMSLPASSEGDYLLSEARVHAGLHLFAYHDYELRGTFNNWGETPIALDVDPSKAGYFSVTVNDVAEYARLKVYDVTANQFLGAGHIENWDYVSGDSPSDSDITLRVGGDFTFLWNPTNGLSVKNVNIEKVTYYFTSLPDWIFNAEAVLFASYWTDTDASVWVPVTVTSATEVKTELTIGTDIGFVPTKG
ncbi:MAG: hypothetical protein K6E59_04735, partial [Bacilli bacterium]|nr:hypothetical protein [Bacilli bacterium]